MSGSPHLDRRDFVKVVVAILGTIMGVIVGLPAISYILSPARQTQEKEEWVPLGPIDSYPIGIPTLFSFTRTTVNGWERTVNSYGAYVWRYSEEGVTVFSNMCTHLACRVTWHDDRQEYICPCHDGIFDIEGEVVSGPPPEAMYEYENKVEEDILYIYVTEV